LTSLFSPLIDNVQNLFLVLSDIINIDNSIFRCLFVLFAKVKFLDIKAKHGGNLQEIVGFCQIGNLFTKTEAEKVLEAEKDSGGNFG